MNIYKSYFPIILMKTCVVCRKELIGRGRFYCCEKCRSRDYYSNVSGRNKFGKEYFNKKSIRWKKKNPKKWKESIKKGFNKFRTEKRERFNWLMLEGYKRNRKKCDSRTRTLKLLKGTNKYVKYNLLKKECKICKSKDNLQVHHEIYPTIAKEIRKALDKREIYYLCKKCHNKKFPKERKRTII